MGKLYKRIKAIRNFSSKSTTKILPKGRTSLSSISKEAILPRSRQTFRRLPGIRISKTKTYPKVHIHQQVPSTTESKIFTQTTLQLPTKTLLDPLQKKTLQEKKATLLALAEKQTIKKTAIEQTLYNIEVLKYFQDLENRCSEDEEGWGENENEVSDVDTTEPADFMDDNASDEDLPE